MSLLEVFEQAQTLPLDEQTKLIKMLVDVVAKPIAGSSKQRSLLELEGLGAEIWAGIDAQEYVNQLRDEWDS
jgi:hypothetical protein